MCSSYLLNSDFGRVTDDEHQAINFTVFAQLVAVVGSGFLAQPIAMLLGGSGETVWLSSAITILTVCLSPMVTQAADF
jgi:hypothetical protein